MSISPEIAGDADLALGGVPLALPAGAIWRFSVDEYHEMVRAGILAEDAPVELLDGCVVKKMMIRPPHAVATDLVEDAMVAVLPKGFVVRSQKPITLSASEPEPDAVAVPGPRRRWVKGHPGPRDVALVVEVADSSLHCDRTLKKAIYAEAGIPAYWIVNLVDRCLEVYTEPSGPAEKPDYAHKEVLRPGDSAPVVVEGREVGRVAVEDVLP